MIQDALDFFVKYVAGTLYVDGVKQSDNWFSGGLLDYKSGLVDPGNTLTLLFEVRIDHEIPYDWIIKNSALVTAYSPLDPSNSLTSVKTNTVEAEVVPEASTFILLATRLFGILALGRRRRDKRK